MGITGLRVIRGIMRKKSVSPLPDPIERARKASRHATRVTRPFALLVRSPCPLRPLW